MSPKSIHYHKPDREEFEQVCKEIEIGEPLNFRQLGRIFGGTFWELVCLSLMDVKETKAAVEEFRKALIVDKEN